MREMEEIFKYIFRYIFILFINYVHRANKKKFHRANKRKNYFANCLMCCWFASVEAFRWNIKQCTMLSWQRSLYFLPSGLSSRRIKKRNLHLFYRMVWFCCAIWWIRSLLINCRAYSEDFGSNLQRLMQTTCN